MELNPNFPIIDEITASLSRAHRSKLNLLFRLINTQINKIRQTHEERPFLVSNEDSDEVSTSDLKQVVHDFLKAGWTEEQVRSDFLALLGYSKESIPSDLFKKEI